MNLRTTAVQLFLLATTATPMASAFVIPSATFTRSVYRAPSTTAFAPAAAAARPSPLRVTDKLFNELEVLAKDLEKEDINDSAKSIKLVVGLIEALESIDHPHSTILTEKPLVEDPVSRKSVSMESDPAEISTSDIAEFKESNEDTTSELIGSAIKILKVLVEDWGYTTYTGKLRYSTYARHAEFPDIDLSHLMKKT